MSDQNEYRENLDFDVFGNAEPASKRKSNFSKGDLALCVPDVSKTIQIQPYEEGNASSKGSWYKITLHPKQKPKFYAYKVVDCALLTAIILGLGLVDVIADVLIHANPGESLTDGLMKMAMIFGVIFLAIFFVLAFVWLIITALSFTIFYVNPTERKLIPSAIFKPKKAISFDEIEFTFKEKQLLRPWRGIEYTVTTPLSRKTTLLIKTIGCPEEIDSLYEWLDALTCNTPQKSAERKERRERKRRKELGLDDADKNANATKKHYRIREDAKDDDDEDD